LQDDQTTTSTSTTDTSATTETAKPARKRAPRKKVADAAPAPAPAVAADETPPSKPARKRAPRKKVADTAPETKAPLGEVPPTGTVAEAVTPAKRSRRSAPAVTFQSPEVRFQPPPVEPDTESPRARTRKPRIVVADERLAEAAADTASVAAVTEAEEQAGEDEATRSRRRRRGRRGRGRKGEATGEAGAAEQAAEGEPDTAAADDAAESEPAAEDESEEARNTRRRRRRRRGGGGGGEDATGDDPPRTVVKVREPRSTATSGSEVRGLSGSTRLEAKKMRRREGRDQSRRRPPVITEAEFLARRESVERVMLVQEYDDRTQIAVLEDGILVEHYVTKAQATSYAGNVYLGRVQNVLPSMEAAFVDIGKGRNAVLYAGEVNYDTSALEGRAPRIEQALKSGQEIVVQVTKDPIGQKGARLTSQVSLPGRYMVYVPEGSMTGISRKLPDSERSRLKGILKNLKPEGAGIIIRTAAEGASEDDLTADLNRLKAQWEVIEKKAKKDKAPALLHGEPDLVIRVIRDNFNEDFAQLVVNGAGDHETIRDYLEYLAPDLLPRLEKWVQPESLFDHYRVNEQLLKALDRKVWLPSGGSLVIDRTEAMTVVDVNTGKFTGKGGNLEETVTKNNLEAAEEIVRQLRLRDIGGIIVVDFIDMVLESNRELVMRRLKECLGRDRTKHQVAEITSLGLLQMTRKRISQGLVEAFSEVCPDCNGRGIKVHTDLLGGTPDGQKQRKSEAAKPKPRPIPRPPKALPVEPSALDLDAAPPPKAVAAAAARLADETEDDWAWAAGSPEPAVEPVEPVEPADMADKPKPARRRGGRGRTKASAAAAAEG
jgi:ribonuclease E